MILKHSAEKLRAALESDAYYERVAELIGFNGDDYKSTPEQQELVEMIIEQTHERMFDNKKPDLSQLDMYAQSLYLCGLNTKKINFIKDETYGREMMVSLLDRAVRSEALFSEEVVACMGMHAMGKRGLFVDYAEDALDEYLTDKRKVEMLENVVSRSIDIGYPLEEVGAQIEKIKEKNPELAPEKSENREAKPAESPVVDDSRDTPMPALADTAVSDERMTVQQNLEKLIAQNEHDRQLVMDVKLEAQARLREKFLENPSFVERTIVDRLKTKFKNLNPMDPREYPSESILSRTISEVDANGMMTKEHLKLKKNIFLGLKVEFSNPATSPEMYDIAVLSLRKEGIKNPHIGSSLKSPQATELFLNSMVDALVRNGYDIEDISVDKHMQPDFDRVKAERYPTFTLSGEKERPEDIIEPTEERTLEEIIYDNNIILNTKLDAIRQAVADDPTKEQVFMDMMPELRAEIIAVMPMLSTSSENWNESIREEGISPSNQKLLAVYKQDVSKLLDKVVKSTEGGKKIGEKQFEKLVAMSGTLADIFPNDKRLQVVGEVLGVDIAPTLVEVDNNAIDFDEVDEGNKVKADNTAQDTLLTSNNVEQGRINDEAANVVEVDKGASTEAPNEVVSSAQNIVDDNSKFSDNDLDSLMAGDIGPHNEDSSNMMDDFGFDMGDDAPPFNDINQGPPIGMEDRPGNKENTIDSPVSDVQIVDEPKIEIKQQDAVVEKTGENITESIRKASNGFSSSDDEKLGADIPGEVSPSLPSEGLSALELVKGTSWSQLSTKDVLSVIAIDDQQMDVLRNSSDLDPASVDSLNTIENIKALFSEDRPANYSDDEIKFLSNLDGTVLNDMQKKAVDKSLSDSAITNNEQVNSGSSMKRK